MEVILRVSTKTKQDIDACKMLEYSEQMYRDSITKIFSCPNVGVWQTVKNNIRNLPRLGQRCFYRRFASPVVGNFDKYLYLFIQLSHFVTSIALAEVEHKISQ